MMKPCIIPIFIPHRGCRHNCIFCNQKKITNIHNRITAEGVEEAINISIRSEFNKNKYIEVAYYGGSFTALSILEQNELLKPALLALEQGKINRIRLSTRPDCINDEILKNLKKHGVSIIELGVQSMDDNVLNLAKRGHTALSVKESVKLLRKYNFIIGLQVMPGLPGETMASFINTALEVSLLQPNFVRIYPAVVLVDTELGKMYKAQCYTPLYINEAIKRAAFLKILCLQKNIDVIRTGLQATEELSSDTCVLAGPYHPAFGELVDSYIYLQIMLKQLDYISCSSIDNLTIKYNWREESKIRGHKNSNLSILKHRCNITLVPSQDIKAGNINFYYKNINYISNIFIIE